MRILQNILLLSTLFVFLYSSDSIVTSSLSTGSAVVPNDKEYFKHKDSHVEIIFTKENLLFAKQTAEIENHLHKDYEDFYNWKLDDTLFVGLISSHNQIANGFSTQWPKNRQINYMGGTQMIDYFTATSWLDTLIYHETAHNYQLNVKGSKLSQNMHTVFGNGSVLSYLLPITVPNSMENSFMLEGNAVLNESWHGNGGRLFSGRFKAQTILQAKAGNIVASEVYNSKLAFPYSDIYYIVGGFYNLYMAQNYGMKSINSYFKYHSQDVFFPQYTNKSMKKATGVSFEQSLNQFAKLYANKPLVMAKGSVIAYSQFFYPLGNDKDEIFFITNESGVQKPHLNVLEKKTSTIKKAKDSWVSGKVIKVDGEYYTQGGKHISPYFIAQGLFCNEGFIKKGTESKMVQGYLSDSTQVYFDVNSSFSQAQLYVGEKFYARVNSSVVIDDKDNLYYFTQNANTRTLYKNKEILYSYEGFYGIVSDVDSKGAVYFIANSKNGATLYRYKDKKVTRASEADNIVEAKLVDDTEILLAAISEKDYYYVKNKLKVINEEPYETKLFFQDKAYYAKNNQVNKIESKIELNDSYTPFLEMHYSGANLIIGSGSSGKLIGSLNLDFGDSLSQNSANIFISRDDSEVVLAGIGYSNAQYIINYSLNLYGVVDDFDRDDVRKSGVVFGAEIPFLRTGYYYGALSASYFQDYDTKYIDEGINEIIGIEHSGNRGIINCAILKIGQIQAKEMNLNIFNLHLQVSLDISSDSGSEIKRLITVSLGNLNTTGI